jgi:hypothetical protein
LPTSNPNHNSDSDSNSSKLKSIEIFFRMNSEALWSLKDAELMDGYENGSGEENLGGNRRGLTNNDIGVERDRWLTSSDSNGTPMVALGL